MRVEKKVRPRTFLDQFFEVVISELNCNLRIVELNCNLRNVSCPSLKISTTLH